VFIGLAEFVHQIEGVTQQLLEIGGY